MAVFDDLLVFAMDREPWQQDAIRRFVTQAAIVDADVNDIYLMLKAWHRLIDVSLSPVALGLETCHALHGNSDAVGTVLNSVENLENCNRLANNQKLRFAVTGLTLIYGDNGCGKSGYCRVLKKVCRVRDGADEQILGNAFAASNHPPAKATVRYTPPGDTVKELAWTYGDGPVGSLSCVSVFDAKTVPLYADKANKIEFLPQGLDVLPKLGDLCKKFAERLDIEIQEQKAKIAIALPAFPTGTEVAALVDKLSPNTQSINIPAESLIEKFAVWNIELQSQLDLVVNQLNTDPSKLIEKYKVLRASVLRLHDRLADAETSIGSQSLTNLLTKISAANDARNAAVLAASSVFGSEPLSGVGGEPWRLMFEQARRFSAVAYPNNSFPVTGPDKLCLLCQQTLQNDASDRLKRFDDYLKTALADEAVKLEAACDNAITIIKTWNSAFSADVDTTLDGLKELLRSDVEVTEAVASYIKAIAPRKAAIVEAFPNTELLVALPPLPQNPCSLLRTVVESLDSLIAVQQTVQQPEQRKVLENTKNELFAKKMLHESLVSVLQRRLEILKLIALHSAKEACDTRSISLKNTELRRTYLTKDFADRVNTEKEKLNLGHIPIKVSDRSDRGNSYMAVDIEAEMSVRNSAILSEGEFRALALACFLADTNSIDGHAGIIIDDPVSSLDHLRTAAVAERLVCEAKTRQVIIFTHDLCLYHEVTIRAGNQGVPLLPVWIRKSAEHGFGIVAENDEPWTIKKVSSRIGHLEQRMARVKTVPDQCSDEYRDLAKDFYTDLRETWERLVEEILLNGVVTRFHVGIKTQSLREACVEDSDHKRVYYGMTRASEYSGHDRTIAREIDYPTPSQMQHDLKDIKDYAAELKIRTKMLSERRKELEEPPLAEVV